VTQGPFLQQPVIKEVLDAVQIGLKLLDVARDLFAGKETPHGARRRVDDILPEKSYSEQAAEELERGQ
jgi:hypothetical protein